MRLTTILFYFTAYWSLLGLFTGGPVSTPAPRVNPVSASPMAVLASEDERSLEFVENRGQWPQQVRFAAQIPSGKMFLEATGFRYVLRDPAQLAQRHPHDQPENASTSKVKTAAGLQNHAYFVSFEGAQPNAFTQGHQVTSGVRNYYLGNDPQKWGSGAKAFRKVTYQDLYPGVDVALYEKAGQLKYDVLVAPGFSPDQVKLSYKGVSGLSLQNGNLKIETSVGTVTEHRPVAFQYQNGQKQMVACQYVLTDGVLSFSFPQGYNAALPLVIDPVIEFSTFSGSTADNWGYTATFDSEGNMYSGGIVDDVGYPVSLGAFMTSFNGNWDIALIKYNTKVKGPASRLYATYLGGQETDTPHSLVVNSNDELLVLGTTSSRNYPISATAYSTIFKGGAPISPLGGEGNPRYENGSDLVITRLSKTGEALLASTFLGGTANDGVMEYPSQTKPTLVKNYGDQFRGDIITDAEGNVYLASNTMSTNFPALNGFQNQARGGQHDAVITKLSPDLSTIIWSNYYGGPGVDAAYSIQIDAEKNVYVAGGTTSESLPGTQAGYQPAFNGKVDGFVLKIHSGGKRILAGTFLGTAAYDQAYFLQLDPEANVYLFGQTLGNYPVSGNVYKNPNSTQFIQKLDNTLTHSIFSTVFGSGRKTIDISPSAFLVDDCQRIYVAGWGGGSNTTAAYLNGTTMGLPISANALQPTTDGKDFYLMQLGTNASELLYGTFYGGNQSTSSSGEHVDGGTSRFDKRGFVYQSVCGGCRGQSNFPMPPGANYFSQRNPSPNCNNAAFKFDFVEELEADAGPDSTVCFNADPVVLVGTPAGGIWSGKGVSANNGVYWFNTMPDLVGSHLLTYTMTGSGACARSSSMTLTVAPPTPHTLAMAVSEFCYSSADPVLLEALPGGGIFSGRGVVGNTFIPALAGEGRHTITYRNTGLNGICGEITKEVTVIKPNLYLGPDTILCPGSNTPFQLKANLPGGVWSGLYVTPAGLFTPPANFTGSTEVSYSINSPCPAVATRRVQVAPVPVMQANLANPCLSQPSISGYLPFTASFANKTTGATAYSWTFGDGKQSSDAQPKHVYTKAGTYAVWLTATYGNGCTITQEVAQVVVKENFIPNIITPNGDQKNDVFVQHFSCLPTQLIVYNLWGQEVYKEAIYNQTWNGGDLAEGTYFYLLKDTDGNTAKGWVEILR